MSADSASSKRLPKKSSSRKRTPKKAVALPKLFQDAWLMPFLEVYQKRQEFVARRRREFLGSAAGKLAEKADWHLRYGLHRQEDGNWLFREWLPGVTSACLMGEFNRWEASPWFELHPVEGTEDWEAVIPGALISHGQAFQLYVEWPGGNGWRLPTATRCIRRETQADGHVLFNAVAWEPETEYVWKHDDFKPSAQALIYEAHVGIAQSEPRVGTWREFADNILPRIAKDGYTCVQLMAVAEHPYYASFGYHVSNYYTPADNFGSPDDLKYLVDTAHGLGLRVIMDLVHSHSVKNELEGLGNFAGHREQFFHAGAKGEHPAWNSYCFDYSKPQVLRFLLSNCRFWLEEYHFDGFRFDGVTSMLYFDHGLGHAFTSYDDYFGPNVDWDSVAYLTLANELCHSLGKEVWTIAEDVSGMPGLGMAVADGGMGFDFRLAMGVTDFWFKLLDRPDEFWDIGGLWYELTNRRQDEKTISYVECHDQALVGGQTFLFRCLGSAMYDSMDVNSRSLLVDRGIALHKMARLATAATAGQGYLNFIGNEFGHPEWLDFPRIGNGWSYDHARRRWDLCDAPQLRYQFLNAFDQAMMALLKSVPEFYEHPAEYRLVDNDRHLIVFERAGLLFACNFHPTECYVACELPCEGHEYALVLDSDAGEFNGFGRVEPGQHYFNLSGEGEYRRIAAYLPNRTALVLKKVN